MKRKGLFDLILVVSMVVDSIANIYTPKDRMRPSDWAAKNVRLRPGRTPSPGAWDNDYFPWIRPILDCWHNEPEKEGWVTMKPAQHGITDLTIVLMLCLADQEGGPMAIACTTDEI